MLFGLSAHVDLDSIERDLLKLLPSKCSNEEFPTVVSSEYKMRATVCFCFPDWWLECLLTVCFCWSVGVKQGFDVYLSMVNLMFYVCAWCRTGYELFFYLSICLFNFDILSINVVAIASLMAHIVNLDNGNFSMCVMDMPVMWLSMSLSS